MATRAARRGTFGRLPRAAPNISATLAAIAREMANAEDNNIMSAWQKGGTVDGVKVTDQMVLAHWKDRLAHVDKGDPLYDTYKQNIDQLDYTIHESKVTAAYAQGKIGPGAVASFYLNWAKKVPKNSEFYRVLQRDAGQFTRAAGASNKAAFRAAQEKAYGDAQMSTYNKQEASGNYLSGVFRTYSQTHGLVSAGEDFNSYNAEDPQQILDFIKSISGTPGNEVTGGGVTPGNSGVLYNDPLTGKAITGAAVLAHLKKMDPNFTGDLTLGYFQSKLKDQRAGQDERLRRATRTGHATDANALQRDQQYTSELAREVHAWPAVQAYEDVRGRFLQTWNDPSTNPIQKLAAYKQYVADLNNIVTQYPRTDDATKIAIQNEANGVTTTDTVAENAMSLHASAEHIDVSGAAKGDTAETMKWIEVYQGMVDSVDGKGTFWTVGKYDSNGNFFPGPGNQLGGASADDIVNSNPPAGVTQIYIPNGLGKAIPVQVPLVPVNAKVVDENGVAIPNVNPNATRVGLSAIVPINGVPTRLFSWVAPDGQTKWTQDPPWAAGVKMSFDGNAVTLTVSVTKPDMGAVASDDKIWHVDYGVTGVGEGKLSVNPGQIAFDPARSAAGNDPASDFGSPTYAALTGSSDGLNVLKNMASDPQFQLDMQQDALSASVGGNGTGVDEATGLPVNPDGYARNWNQQNIAGSANTPDDLNRFYNNWDRTSTTPAYQPPGRLGDDSKGAPLPSDQTRGTLFDALGSAFVQATNLLTTPPKDPTDQLSIKMRGSLTLPSIAAQRNVDLPQAKPYTTPPVKDTVITPSAAPPGAVYGGNIGAGPPPPPPSKPEPQPGHPGGGA